MRTAQVCQVPGAGRQTHVAFFRVRRSGGDRSTTSMPASPAAEAVVDCAVYVDGRRLAGKYTHEAAVAEVRERGEGFVWLGLLAPDEEQMAGVATTFGLHELAVEDAVQAHQRPKLERYDDLLFLVLRTVVYIPRDSRVAINDVVETGEIMVFVGDDFVVTVRHGDHTGLSTVRADLENNPERLALGPSAVVHAIADHVVDSYLDVTASIEDDVDSMEEAVFRPRTKVSIEHIYLLKREIIELRKSVNPLSNPLLRLARRSASPIPKEIRRFFGDVLDHHTIVAERIAQYDELLGSLVDAALAKVSVQQNTDMRKISAWVALAAVPTMVAGIYGMNFGNMPAVDWEYGYHVVLGLIAVVIIGLVITFKRNHWL
ncbi:MAG: magnesium and cobalt transport protein CorA [Rhodococcus sp.]|nr:magnesium and cobalt transport protein CorA [Rhodococcus sp. (in: high G+C Gram-positive bacteria)]